MKDVLGLIIPLFIAIYVLYIVYHFLPEDLKKRKNPPTARTKARLKNKPVEKFENQWVNDEMDKQKAEAQETKKLKDEKTKDEKLE